MEIKRIILILMLLLSISICGSASNSDSGDESDAEEIRFLTFERGDIVYYSGFVTTKEAFALGKFLYEVDYFHISSEDTTAVWILGELGVFYIRFTVVEGAWEDSDVLESAHEYLTAISNNIFTDREVVLQICDEEWHVKQELRRED